MGTTLGNRMTDDSIGFYVDFANKRSFSPNMLNYSNWNVGNGTVNENTALYGSSGYPIIGIDVENVRSIGIDPFGYNGSVVWRSSSFDGNGTGPDGGWNGTLFPIDPTKIYRFSLWTKRDSMTIGPNNAGSFYLGFSAFDSATTEQSLFSRNTINWSTTNPYLHATWGGSLASVQPPYLGGLNTWTLVVGHIWPAGTATASIVVGSGVNGLQQNYSHPDSGIWTRAGGKVGNTLSSSSIVNEGSGYADFIWNSWSAKARHRAYHFYSADIAATQSFIYPRVDLVDGLEPTIGELLSGSEPVRDLSVNKNTIYPFGSSNFDKEGKGLVFSGLEREIVGGSLATTFVATSISVWFCPSSTILTSTPTRTLVQFGPVDNAALFLYLGEVTGSISNEIISIVSSAGNTMTYVTTTSVPSLLANTWYNVALSFNGTKYDIYLNGVSMATVANPAGNTVPTASVNYVAIGGRRYGAVPWGDFFQGRIGSVVAYGRALTGEEILADYNLMKRKYETI